MGRFADALPRIDDALSTGDARGAFTTLRPWLSYPGRVEDDEWATALEALARVGREIVGEAFVELATAARERNDVQSLFDLGYELIEQELADVAATMLARAVRQRPDLPGLLSELVAALEREGRHAEACRWLEGAPALLEKAFILRFLLAWNTAMTGDHEAAKARLAQLDHASNGSEALMRERLELFLARAAAVRGVTALDHEDLRGWHFALHGSFILRLSPHGFKEGMRGRYALTQDSELRCREGIERVRIALDALGIEVPRVLCLPDRDSVILGVATAQVLRVPLVDWSATHMDSPGLVVAYDLGAVGPDLLAQLHAHRPGQVLWEHASRWVVERPVAADLVTYVYQYNVAPWAEHVVVDKATGGALRAPADDSPTDVIASRVAALAVDDKDLLDRTVLVDFLRACVDARVAGEPAVAALRELGLRERQYTGGPVSSNRFR